MSKGNLNGSSDILAEAMRQAFADAAEGAMKPMRRDLSKLSSQADTGLAELKADIAEVRGESVPPA